MPPRGITGHGTGGRVAVPVAIAVGVPSGARRRVERVVGIVDEAVAVVVVAVARFERGGAHVGAGVVAVGGVGHPAGAGVAHLGRCGGIAVPIQVGVGVPRASAGEVERVVLVVHEGVAVIVGVVADLDRTGVDGRAAVIALGASRKAVAVHVGVAHRPVAVVVVRVFTVLFGSARVVGRIGVVAVATGRAGALDRLARQHGQRVVPIAVAIGVGVERGRYGAIVHHAVAVVVEAVAHVLGAGVHGGVGVVAVVAHVGVALGAFAEAVGLGFVAVAVEVGVVVPGRRSTHSGVVVVAVLIALEPVAVAVGHDLGGGAGGAAARSEEEGGEREEKAHGGSDRGGSVSQCAGEGSRRGGGATACAPVWSADAAMYASANSCPEERARADPSPA